MTLSPRRFPPLFITAWIMFVSGLVCIGLTLTLQTDAHIFKGLLTMSFALLTFGIGEIINHPKERLFVFRQDSVPLPPQLYRRRNICSLGNLCDICGILLFFIGLATLLYRK